MPSVYIKTYGCQMNERDSEAVAASFIRRGYALARSESVADVVLLNTCSVRDQAERKAVGKMRTLAAEVRRHRPHVLLGFLGCMAQSRGEELVRDVPGVRLVLGTQKFHRAGELVDELLAGRRKTICEVVARPWVAQASDAVQVAWTGGGHIGFPHLTIDGTDEGPLEPQILAWLLRV